MSQAIVSHTWTRLQCNLLAPATVQRSDGDWSIFLEHAGTWIIHFGCTFQALWRHGGVVVMRLAFERGQTLTMAEQWLALSWATPPRSARGAVRLLLHYQRKRALGRRSPHDDDLFLPSGGAFSLHSSVLLTVDMPQSIELSAFASGDMTEAQASNATLVAHRMA